MANMPLKNEQLSNGQKINEKSCVLKWIWEVKMLKQRGKFDIFPFFAMEINLCSEFSCRNKTNDQNVIRLQFLMQLYAYNETRYQFWRKSKVQCLRKEQNEEEMGPNLKV